MGSLMHPSLERAAALFLPLCLEDLEIFLCQTLLGAVCWPSCQAEAEGTRCPSGTSGAERPCPRGPGLLSRGVRGPERRAAAGPDGSLLLPERLWHSWGPARKVVSICLCVILSSRFQRKAVFYHLSHLCLFIQLQGTAQNHGVHKEAA